MHVMPFDKTVASVGFNTFSAFKIAHVELILPTDYNYSVCAIIVANVNYVFIGIITLSIAAAFRCCNAESNRMRFLSVYGLIG